MLNQIAAVVDGTSLFGGRGSVLTAKGLVIVLAIAVDKSVRRERQLRLQRQHGDLAKDLPGARRAPALAVT